MNIYFKVELTRYLYGLDGSCGRKKRVQDNSSFGLSRWKDNVVINLNDKGRRRLYGKYQECGFGKVKFEILIIFSKKGYQVVTWIYEARVHLSG